MFNYEDININTYYDKRKDGEERRKASGFHIARFLCMPYQEIESFTS